jgi:RND superfamily putative drug exporter
VFATALGAGILLDATIVRALLVPAAVALFGRWNWWLPLPLAKILPPSPRAVRGLPPTRQTTENDMSLAPNFRCPAVTRHSRR